MTVTALIIAYGSVSFIGGVIMGIWIACPFQVRIDINVRRKTKEEMEATVTL
jgi:hypothetical protein